MSERLFICYLPFGPVGFTAEELSEWAQIPDNQGLAFRIETAEPEDEHSCSEDDRAHHLFAAIMAVQ